MALSTSITVVTRSGLSTHDHYDVRNLFSVGVATFSNFKLTKNLISLLNTLKHLIIRLKLGIQVDHFPDNYSLKS